MGPGTPGLPSLPQLRGTLPNFAQVILELARAPKGLTLGYGSYPKTIHFSIVHPCRNTTMPSTKMRNAVQQVAFLCLIPTPCDIDAMAGARASMGFEMQ